MPAITPPNGNEMEMTFSEVSALEDTMLSDEQRRKDKAEGMGSVECPAGSHIAMRMSIERVERADEHVGVKRQECGHVFDWEVPKSS